MPMNESGSVSGKNLLSRAFRTQSLPEISTCGRADPSFDVKVTSAEGIESNCGVELTANTLPSGPLRCILIH
jgi:hypothetical protein